VIDAIEEHGMRATMATLGQVEVLTGSARAGDPADFERAAQGVRTVGLHFQPLTEAIAEDAAWLRGKSSLKLADAVHLASARAAGATAFITNDRRIGSHPRVEVFYLDDLVLEDPAAA
jgi:predicted nucleic acid-binding protein